VLPIGGLKEKLLAAHRANLKTVVIPKDNEKDLDEVPANILKALEIIRVDHVDEVLKVALVQEEMNLGETLPGESPCFGITQVPAVNSSQLAS